MQGMVCSEKTSRKDDVVRYMRQTVLPGVGPEGQARLERARILCVGVGGLGCPALLYLAAAGVGELGVVDDDCADISNLQRQVLFETEDQGKPKVDIALRRLKALNPHVELHSHRERLSTENVLRIFQNYDIIIDGTDNFSTKYLINDAAVTLGLPVVYGSVSCYEGQVCVFWAVHGPCYRCLYPYPPKGHVPNCAEAGVLGPLTGMIGSMQAMEAMKLALSSDVLRSLVGRLVVLNAADMTMAEFGVTKDPGCPVCSDNPSITELVAYERACATEEVQDEFEITATELSALSRVEIIDVRTYDEWASKRIPGARNIPLSNIVDGSDIDLTGGDVKVLYCVSGIRSKQALMALREKGVQNIRHLKGGIMQWPGATSTGAQK